MIKLLNKKTMQMGAAFTVGMMLAPEAAHATAAGNNFNTIAGNIVDSISYLPGLLSALSYIFGILIGTLVSGLSGYVLLRLTLGSES